MLAHGSIEGALAGMAEWGMANVMDKSEGLDQVYIESKLCADGARDLRDLQRMGQTVAEVIGKAAGEDLRFGLEPAKGPRMHDAVAVALELVAIAVQGFGITASAGMQDSVRSETFTHPLN